MTEKQHTPTPFKLECLGSEGHQIRPVLGKSLSEIKAECGGLNEKFYDRVHPIATIYGEFFQQKANADFIVKACNNHDKLLATLKEIKDFCAETGYTPYVKEQIIAGKCFIAIEKAEEA